MNSVKLQGKDEYTEIWCISKYYNNELTEREIKMASRKNKMMLNITNFQGNETKIT